MTVEDLMVRARQAAKMNQQELADRARTSRPTLSAYERGRKSPTLATAARLVAEAGFEMTIQSRVAWTERRTYRGRVVSVPSALPRLDPATALATVRLPVHLNWSQPDRWFDLQDRQQRARVYEIVIREGGPDDIAGYIDGLLLVDLWDELVLPRDVRDAWSGLVGHDRTDVA